MKWLRMTFKHANKVYVPVDDALNPIEDNGVVKFVYKLAEGSPAYTAKRSNLTYIEGAEVTEYDMDVASVSNAKPKSQAKPKERLEVPEMPLDDGMIPPGVIVVYTDGGASPNPGPGGLGVLLIFGEHKLELWEFYEHTTNNVLELTAIRRALQRIHNKTLPVIIHSDSAYAIGVLTGSMKAKLNKELIAEIQSEMAEFTNLQLRKVRAHVGVQYNEHVDQLCQLARDTRSGGERRS